MPGKKQLMSLNISGILIQQSVESLKASPNKEKVLLWLGRKTSEGYTVDEILTPIQITEADYFHIPEEGMEEIMNRLRVTRKMLVAQIHTHPGHAYHSMADDNWAIVRHEGAYSLVLPFFCSTTTESNFLENVATFVLNKSNDWVEVDNENISIL